MLYRIYKLDWMTSLYIQLEFVYPIQHGPGCCNCLWDVLMRTFVFFTIKINEWYLVRKLNLKFTYVNQHDSVSVQIFISFVFSSWIMSFTNRAHWFGLATAHLNGAFWVGKKLNLKENFDSDNKYFQINILNVFPYVTSIPQSLWTVQHPALLQNHRMVTHK